MKTSIVNDLNESHSPTVPILSPYGVIMALILILSHKGVIKGQPPNIAMFGVELKVLMSTLTIGD